MLSLVGNGEASTVRKSRLSWLLSIITRRRPEQGIFPARIESDDDASFGSPTPTRSSTSSSLSSSSSASSTATPPSSCPDSPTPTESSEDDSEFASAPTSPTAEHAFALPTYAQVAYPAEPRTYAFTQRSPFAMVMASEGAGDDARFTYYISVGVNVWMPSCVNTFVRRGGEDGRLIAQLELGITAETAVVVMGEARIPLKGLLTRKNLASKSRFYHLDDGTTIKWVINKHPWQATVGSTTLATFEPDSGSSRKLTVYPAGYPLFDHLVIGLLVLMREYLTPSTAQIGGAAGLFNYHPHALPNDPL